MTTAEAALAVLRWYADAGVDEAIGADPTDFFAADPILSPKTPPPPSGKAVDADEPNWPQRNSLPPPPIAPIAKTNAPSTDEAVAAATNLAASCDTFEALCAAIEAFDGCALKNGARNTVVFDGVIGADLLIMGEAPGRDEDRVGKPFVGRAGQLLDKMLGSIGRSRTENTLISNVIFWRPPGNRTPTATEVAVCKPFVDRLIHLNQPKAIVLAGNAPLQALLGRTGITRARGNWSEIEGPGSEKIPVLPMFHPAFLLRRPEQKRLAWHDLQSVAARLTNS